MNKKQWKKEAKYLKTEYKYLRDMYDKVCVMYREATGRDWFDVSLENDLKYFSSGFNREEQESKNEGGTVTCGMQFIGPVDNIDDSTQVTEEKKGMSAEEMVEYWADEYDKLRSDAIVLWQEKHQLREALNKLKEEFDELEACVAEQLVSEQSAVADSGKVVNELSTFNEFPQWEQTFDYGEEIVKEVECTSEDVGDNLSSTISFFYISPSLPTADELRGKYEQNLNEDSSTS